MTNKKIFSRLLIIALISLLFVNILSFSAYAAPDDGGSGEIAETPADDTPADGGEGSGGDNYEPGYGGDLSGDPVPDDQGENAEEPTEPADIGDEYYGYGQATDAPEPTSYIEPEHLDELPEAIGGEVIEATAIVIPKAEVTNASLLSGIIMWLCVAVGIAVVVGVMVSKRTHNRNV